MSCTRCKWHDNSGGLNCVEYFGPEDVDIIFMGESYIGIKGNDFASFAGEELNRLITFAKIDRKKIGIMNSMRCYQSNFPTPTKKELDACFFHTFREINKLKPKLVVAMGGAALYQATGLDGVERHRGQVIMSDRLGGVRVYVTFQPGASKYDKSKAAQTETDFKNLKNAFEDKPFECKHYPYIYVDTIDKFIDAAESVIGEEVKFDIESTGLDPYRDNVTLIQFAARQDKIFVVDMRVIDDREMAIKIVRKLFQSCKIVGQGFDFDAKFLSVQYDIYPNHIAHDTCLGEYVLTGMKANDLTFLTDKYAPESAGYDADVKRAGGAHMIKDQKKLLQYSADDIGVMFPIQRKQTRGLMKQTSMWKSGFTAEWCLKNLTLPCSDVLSRMSLQGLTYDVEKLRIVDEKYAKKGRRALMKAMTLDGVLATQKHFKQQFNPRSSNHVKWMMLNYYELPVLATTKKDNPSVGKDELKIYAKKYHNEYAMIMEKYRSIQNIRDNFLSGVIPKLQDGVAHTDFSLHGTASGRPISKDPNILNIPDDDDIRACIVAPRGYIFVYSDLSQIEVREASVIYEEPKLIEYCNTVGADFHCLTTSNMFQIPYEEVFKWYREYENGSKDKRAAEMHGKRSAAKTITFGILYQMGAETLAYRLGITKAKAEEFIRAYFAGFPNLEKNIEKVKWFINKNGYVDTWFGFRRSWEYYGENEHKAQREGVNHPIQGTAWNIMEKILIETDDYVVQSNMVARLCWQNYDSLMLLARKEEVDDVAPKMQSIMQNVQAEYDTLNQVNIIADIKTGYDLANLKKIL